MDLLSGALRFIGGLAMFLFGMTLMGEGLERRTGSTLKSVLERMTEKRFRGLLLGMGVTAAIQSSSAVSVMVVGFVNSGMMTLHQSIGVIMGANIGTTITSWLLGLTGIKGDTPILFLLKPTSFTPILALFGVFFYVLSKKKHKSATGLILLGFTVLIYGMERMSDAVAPLADSPSFARILLIFENPFFGVLAGAILTAIIQSSSASVGILQALAATGGLSYATVIPIVMGQNIGTCATSLISSVGTSTNAKRAAMIHLYFNLLGTISLLSVFYLVNWLFPLSFMRETVTPFSIAIVHTVFNVLSTVLLFPFASKLEKFVVLTVREKNGKA